MFILHANKTQLTVREREPVTSGSVNVYRARFEFSPDWEGMTRKAVFIGSGAQVPVPLDETGECDIPWEVLTKHGGQLLAGVYGTTDDSTLPTIRVGLGIILEGVTVDGSDEADEIVAQDTPSKGEGEDRAADHRALANRDAAEQHPIESISGLKEALSKTLTTENTLSASEIVEILGE